MKKLLVTVNGVKYEVEVEVIEDDDTGQLMPPFFQPQMRSSDDSISRSGIKTNSLFSPVKVKSSVNVNKGDENTLQSPINGILIEICAKVGQKVEENDVLFILESMKMKTNINSPHSGIVKSIEVKENDPIEAGQTLLNYE